MSENNIPNTNADAQESADAPQAEATTATTNAPAAEETTSAESTTQPVIENTVSESLPQPVEEKLAAHDDFDWSVDKRNVTHYNKEEKEKYDHVYENTFVTIEDGEIVNGNVVALTKTDVVVNIGFKSDGLVSANEFRDNPALKVGDIVEVMVVEKEDREGNLHLKP